ncbi:MAG TPA: hypothetical protein VIO16_07160, partial [Dehalococcoidia bacterium]
MTSTPGAVSDTGAAAAASRVYGGFADLMKPDSKWQLGGFALPDGTSWQYREPNAVVVVQN